MLTAEGLSAVQEGSCTSELVGLFVCKVFEQV
jgi:hypothetical protein